MLRAIALALPVAITLAGCSNTSYVRSSFRTKTGSGLIEARGDDPVGIVYYEDGELYGVEAAERISSTRSGRWLRHRDAVDHPRLPEWRHQLLRSQELAEEGRTGAIELVGSVRGLPFRQAKEDLYDKWLADSPARAAELLDRITDLGVGREYATALCQLALKDHPSDIRTARWMKAFARENHRDAATLLIRSDASGSRTARAALRDLDEFPSSHRRAIFSAAAARLATTRTDARLIVSAAEELSSADEAAALIQVLRREAVSPDLPVRVLMELDERPSRSRPKLFEAAFRDCRTKPTAAQTVVRGIRQMTSSHRYNAARHVLSYDDTHDQIIRALVTNLNHIRYSDRSKFVIHLIESRHYHTGLANSIHRAVQSHISNRRSRAAIYKAISEHPATKGRKF